MQNSSLFDRTLDTRPTVPGATHKVPGVGKHFLVMAATLAAFLLSGCGGGSSGNGPAVTSQSGSLPSTMSKRVASITIDIDRDGTIDEIWRYTYNESGQIVRVTEESATGEINDSTNYLYENGLLVKRELANFSDTYTYTNGRVDSADLDWDGKHTFTYNDSGSLINSTGSDFFYIDECGDEDSQRSFNISYSSSGKLAEAVADNGYRLRLTYDSMDRISRVFGDCGPERSTDVFGLPYLLTDIYFSYDSNGLLVETKTRDSGISEDSYVIRDTNGRAISLTTIENTLQDNPETITETFSYNDDGFIATQERTVENQPEFSIFVLQDYKITYEYEDKPCKVALSANPATLLIADALLGNNPANSGPVACVFPLDF